MKKKDKINELNMDYVTYSKIKGKLNPQDKKSVTITGDKPINTSNTSVTSTSMSTQMEENEPEAIIEPQDQETIKYLSNVKDANSGEISQPFTIGDKKYQMVRGMKQNKEIILGVYCFDDVNEAGENIIHSLEYFEENIAKPMKEQMGMVGQDIQVVDEFDYSASEREFHDKEELMNYLNLTDIEPGYKLFFVNTKTGEIIAKFKNTKEMVYSGIKLQKDEEFMDLKALKRFRFGGYFNKDINEVDATDGNTDVEKLKTDVKKLTDLIKNKFSVYLSKLDKPIEQAQFLTAMAQQIGVPLNKLNSIISTYKDIAKNEPTSTLQESKVISKKTLEEQIKKIRVIKIKDLQ